MPLLLKGAIDRRIGVGLRDRTFASGVFLMAQIVGRRFGRLLACQRLLRQLLLRRFFSLFAHDILLSSFDILMPVRREGSRKAGLRRRDR
ncbi:MAG: hypothetical protein KIT23_11930, partial [Sphingopyxis sp.]|nr:hypothetical protein [Sphingopyxis sp.]